MYRMMQNKWIALIICGVLSLSLLAGCGQKAPERLAETPAENTVKEETAEAEHADAAEAAETEGTEAEPLPEAEPETAPDTEESEAEPAAAASRVLNNNGHFVQMGDRIYFHVVDADSMGETALWAQYVDTECGRTILFSYDPNTDTPEIVSYDHTSGGIAVQGEILYTGAYKDGEEVSVSAMSTYSDAAGAATVELPSNGDLLLGASADGSFLAVYHYDYVDYEALSQILIYRDGVLQHTWDVDRYCSCVALGDNEVFYIGGDPETGFGLKELDAATGAVIDLGGLPTFLNSNWFGTVDECMLDGNQIYFTYSAYEGTGNFFSEGYFVEAEIGAEYTLRYMDMPEYSEEGDPRAASFAVVDGYMIAAEGKPGTCKVQNNGDLGYFDETGTWVFVSDGWETEFLSEDDDYVGVELAELVGDSIYLICNKNSRAPEDDIGWRYAYYRYTTDIYRVSIETGEAVHLLHQVGPWGDD